MNNDIPLAQLKDVRRTLKELEEEERQLTKPLLTDFGMLPYLFRWFKENGCDTDTPLGRREFLFLILCLYSVGSILGDRLPVGLRPELCKLFPSLSPCSISNNIVGLYIEYSVYADFRNEVNRLYALLQTSGLIPKRENSLFCKKSGTADNTDI